MWAYGPHEMHPRPTRSRCKVFSRAIFLCCTIVRIEYVLCAPTFRILIQITLNVSRPYRFSIHIYNINSDDLVLIPSNTI